MDHLKLWVSKSWMEDDSEYSIGKRVKKEGNERNSNQSFTLWGVGGCKEVEFPIKKMGLQSIQMSFVYSNYI